MARPTISVVIPALDEESHVDRAIASAQEADEILVVDGGSRDETRTRAAAAGARVLESPPGRGVQLARGAAAASGDWLVFLHADTCLEPGWARSLRGLPASRCGGAFRFALDSRRPSFRIVEWGVRARCALLQLPYGDQALFARRTAYDRIGGFAPLPLMEDVDFVRRLRRVGRLAFPPQRAFTSARRWEAHGVVATTLTHAWCLGRYALGADPAQLTRASVQPDERRSL